MVNLREARITNLAAMLQERSGHASVFLKNCIYAAGGQTTTKKKTKIIDSIEKYKKYLFLSIICSSNHQFY